MENNSQKEVEEALDYADRYEGTAYVGLGSLLCLAAEVRRLRDDLASVINEGYDSCPHKEELEKLREAIREIKI